VTDAGAGAPVGGARAPRRRRPRRRGGRWPRLLAGAALGLLCGVPAAAARIERTQSTVVLPPGRSVLSPYLNPRDGTLVLHVQPLQSATPEQWLDARSGRAWSGELPALLRDFEHLGSEAPAGVAAGTAPDLALLRALGCTGAHVICTSALDAEVLLLLGPAGQGGAAATVVDLRALLAEAEEVLAGRRDGRTVDWGDLEWRALEVAAQRPERRARWLDALRSVRDIDAFERLLASVTAAPRLAAQPLFQGPNPAVDLRAELELLGHKLLVGTHASRLLGGDGAAAAALADALERATQPPNQIGVATHLVELLTDRAADDRRRLAERIADEATRRRSEVLHCFARWLDARACGEGAPPWVVSSAPAVPRTPRPEAGPRERIAVAPPAPPAPPATAGLAEATATGGDAPHEWTLIQRVPNKLTLVSFNEATGRMVPDRAVVGGFAFVARALGPVQDGRFEVEVAAAEAAPVRLRHGQYRVRAKLVLDFTREDQCQQGIACWFTRPELHAKSVPREVVFFMTMAGQFVDRRRAEFGTLLPLMADGSARYRSLLKEARLAIESVRFELL